MNDRAMNRTVQRIAAAAQSGLDSKSLRLEAMKILRPALPMDSFWFATADPATLLFTSSVVQEIPQDATAAFVANEFLQSDVNKWVDLARKPEKASSLYMATMGRPEESPRYTQILQPMGFGDELRVALSDGGSCWGFICLHRGQSEPGFSAEEAALLGRLAKHLAEGLRAALLIEDLDSPSSGDEPGLVLLSRDLRVIGTNAAADGLLPDITDWPLERGIPQAIYAVAARLQSGDQPDDGEPAPLPRVRVRTRSGRWLLLHASRLAGNDDLGVIAVIIEPAPSWDVAPLILQAYGLSEREGDVAQLVLQGRSTNEISLRLFISPLTVQQHLKSIFIKTGINSRRELTAKIFSEQYVPRIMSGQRIGAGGWFAQAPS